MVESAKVRIRDIPCAAHDDDIIRRVKTNETDLTFFCSECLVSKQGEGSILLEKFIEQLAQSYSQIPRLHQLPDYTNEILKPIDGEDIVAKFRTHIDNEKKLVDEKIDLL